MDNKQFIKRMLCEATTHLEEVEPDETIGLRTLEYTPLYRREYSERDNLESIKKARLKNGAYVYMRKAIPYDHFYAYILDDNRILKEVGRLAVNNSTGNMYNGKNITFYDSAESIKVDEEYQRLGIGTALLDFAEKIYGKSFKDSKVISPSLRATLDSRKMR